MCKVKFEFYNLGVNTYLRNNSSQVKILVICLLVPEIQQ
jgi:hypothetical protein